MDEDIPTGKNDNPLLEEDQCPRCGGWIPNMAERGAYIGALSRWDNETYVCSDCGQMEAMIQFAAMEDARVTPSEALDRDHDNWYVMAVEAIINAKTVEDARNVLLRLLRE